MSTTSYEPKYVTIDDVPITGPDPFSDTDKLSAIEDAEARIELDTNGGETIDSPPSAISYGVEAYATYQLALGPKSPDSMKAGDFADEGSQRTEFIDHLLQIYRDVVATVNGSGGDGGGSDGGTDGGGGGSGWTAGTYDFEVL